MAAHPRKSEVCPFNEDKWLDQKGVGVDVGADVGDGGGDMVGTDDGGVNVVQFVLENGKTRNCKKYYHLPSELNR